MDHNHEHVPGRGNAAKSRARWVLIAFVLIVAYLLISEHQAHFIQALPYLLLLACPLLHIFMHGGHGGQGGHGGHQHREKGDRRG
jgi:hypothetical protein